MKFYVYIYYDLLTREPFWVGKGKDDRFKINRHFSGHNNYTLKNRLKALSEDNIDIRFIYRNDNEQTCLSKEVYWIAKIGRKDLGLGPLLNLTNGGEGVSDPSEETRKKMSEAGKRKVFSEEHRKNLSIANCNPSEERRRKTAKSMMGEKNHFYGKHHTTKTRLNQSLSHIGIQAGEKNPRAKLTEEQVLEIKTRYSSGDIYQQQLADEYNVTQTTISSIVRHKLWRHI